MIINWRSNRHEHRRLLPNRQRHRSDDRPQEMLQIKVKKRRGRINKIIRRCSYKMSITAKCEGDGIYAGLASKLRTEKDVKYVMAELAKEIAHGNETPLSYVVQIQDFYARKFYKCTKFSEVKAALAEYFV